MKFQYKFSNLFGTVYHKGNLLFTPDGNKLISPVGNRISLYDLRNHKSETLPVESRYNFTTLAVSPNGKLLIAINEPGQALMCSLPHRTVIQHFHFKRPIADIKFSPDGRYIAVTKENNVFIYQVPNCDVKKFNPFQLEKVFKLSYSKTLCIDWTSDSSVIAVGGADATTKIYAIEKFKNLSVYTLGSHTDSVIGCFFEENSLNMYTVSKNGQVCVWDCNIDLKALVLEEESPGKNIVIDCDEEDDIVSKENEETEIEENKDEKFFYKRIKKEFLRDAVLKESKGYITLSAAAFHRKSHILVVGFSNGAFCLYEMPNLYQIHSLSLSNQRIGSVTLNCTGDWIALGCEGIGQLVVWEWQTESFVMKQQGHFNSMQCLSYSPEGMHIATGGEDGKVKIWDTSTGFCIVTFSEHESSVTGIVFSPKGKVVVSASADGTVRAFDLHRYRNFKTFTSKNTSTKFSCLSVDHSGEFVCAATEESFEIYLWSLATGLFLTVLVGHEAPVSCVSFDPSDCILASTSWDKTVRFWNVSEIKSTREAITLVTEGLYIAYRPDGKEIAVSTLDGQISFFNPSTCEQSGTIEGRHDLYVGRRETDLITAKKILKSQAFTSLCYTADGTCILAAGRSKFVCIYNVHEKILLKKFEITCNLSFDGVQDFINRRKMTAFGNKALIEERVDEETIALDVPGSKKIDKSSRTLKPEVNVSSIQFSPTGRAWAATTTEGLLVYSLDNNLIFDPFDLTIDDTPENIRKALYKEDYLNALMMALKLNETKVVIEVIESIKVENVATLVSYLPLLYVEKLLAFIANQLENTPHLEFYLTWHQHIVTFHGMNLKFRSRENMETWNCIHKNLNCKLEELSSVCNGFKFLGQYISVLSQVKKNKKIDESSEDILIENDEIAIENSSDEELMDHMPS